MFLPAPSARGIYRPGEVNPKGPRRSPQPPLGVLHILFVSSGHILGLIEVPEAPCGRGSQPLITPPLRKRLPSSTSSQLLLIFPFWFVLKKSHIGTATSPLQPFALAISLYWGFLSFLQEAKLGRGRWASLPSL